MKKGLACLAQKYIIQIIVKAHQKKEKSFEIH